MAILNIPDGLWDQYHDGEDTMFEALKLPCRLIYKPRKETCPNCVFDPFSQKSTGKYKSGGPQSFTSGLCPVCDGEGYKQIQDTDDIDMQIGWKLGSFIDIFRSKAEVEVGKTFVQTKAKLADLSDIRQAEYVQMATHLEAYVNFRFKIAADPQPSGMKQDRYVLLLWERID